MALLADRVTQFLDEQAESEDFDLNASEDWLENYMRTLVEEWADEHGWKFDEDQCMWRKP